MRYTLIPLLLVALVGCDFDKAIARAEQAVATAKAGSDRAETALIMVEKLTMDAKKALAIAEQVAAATESEQAKKAVATAKDALAQAEAVLPSVREAKRNADSALAASQASVDAAKAAQEAGGSGLEILIAALAGFVPALVPIVGLVKKVQKTTTALRLTAAYADEVEASETDADMRIAKANAQQSQVAADVHGLIQKARRG